jgi:hypothetical protein
MTESRRGIHMVGRRLFLHGAAGAVVGLPLLESFIPKHALAQAAASQSFAIFMRQANGVQQAGIGSEPERFWPSKLGALTTASMGADGDRATSVLKDHAAKLLLVRGVEMKQIVDAGCGHSQGGLLCLTASKANGKNVEKALAQNESIDNRIARELQASGTEPLTLRAGMRSGYLDDVLSYRKAGDRRTAESVPYNAYKALFGLGTTDMNTGGGSLDEAASKLAARRKSVNDLIRAEMKRLLANTKLSAEDRNRLQQHQDAIRDLEVGMQQNACTLLGNDALDPMSKITKSQAESDAGIITTAQFQFKVIALAVACGKVRAATLQVGNGNDHTQYTYNGTKLERFHFISHRVMSDGATGAAIANADMKHHQVDLVFAGLFKTLLDELTSRTTPTGTLLDQGVAIWLNDLANGPAHATRNMPYVCAGSIGGKLKNGVYVDAGNQGSNQYVTHNKFLNTIGAAVGCKNAAGGALDDFGDASLPKGNIPQMLA